LSALLHESPTRQAKRRPDATAVVMDDDQLSYGEVEDTSNQLARALKETGCQRGDRVCLFISKSPAAIVAMLAVLKADCAYVPVDIASPASRVGKMVRSVRPRVVVVDAEGSRLLDEIFEIDIFEEPPCVALVAGSSISARNFQISFSKRDWKAYPSHGLNHQNSSGDLAHILFTSGSTGTPKGVMITHSNVLGFLRWATNYFNTVPSDRISGHPPLHFDLSTFDIFGTLSMGAQLHLVPEPVSLLPHKLADFIRTSELTQWFSVPSALTYMAKFNVVKDNDFPALRRLLWCGEVLPTPTLIYWMRRLPNVRFTNLYGPTEATIASSFYSVTECPRRNTDAIPIGTACEGEELLVLDQGMGFLPSGHVGDLYIGGVGLSPGYWEDEAKTRNAFLQDPRVEGVRQGIYRTGDLARRDDDGLFYFVGRADTQVKSRGYRIELGEIETALNSLEEIKECAVVGVKSEGFEGTLICCAYAPLPGASITPSRARELLIDLVPSYMFPSRWLTLEGLPKNVNGKIDRPSLRERFEREATVGG
jgi:amino acid adenylation domain-containing protein